MVGTGFLAGTTLTLVSEFDPSQYPGSGPAPTGAAAGWYPVDHLSQRYWDGYEWTNHVAPLPQVGAVASFGMAMTTSDERNYALFMHLGSLFVGFLVPLIMWLIKKDDSAFIDHHGRSLMNWNISLIIYSVVSVILILVIIGVFMLLALIVLHLVFSILGAVAANKGDSFSYPLALPLFS